MSRNIAVIILDSVRKDFFDQRASRIKSLADVSVDRAYAPSSWSTPSHASMFTGELPSDHGVHTYQRSFKNIQHPLFHSGLPHQSLGVSANIFAGGSYGFDDSFDVFRDIGSACRYPRGIDPEEFDLRSGSYSNYLRFLTAMLSQPNTVESMKNVVGALLHTQWKRIPGPKLVDDSGRAVCRTAEHELLGIDEPWFLFVNFMDAHIPLQHFVGLNGSDHGNDWSWCSDQYDMWDLTTNNYPDYWSIRKSVYGAYLDYLDRLIAQFVSSLLESTASPTTVVVTADHGENHGEQSAGGMANHKSSLSEQLLHVPFEIINAPEPYTEPMALFTLLDLPEMVEDFVGGRCRVPTREIVPAEVMGMSAGPEPPEGLDSEYYDRTIRAAYRGNVKFVWDSLGNVERYEIDPSVSSEQTLSAEDVPLPEWAEKQFSAGIDEARRNACANREEYTVSRSVESRLERLGYK